MRHIHVGQKDIRQQLSGFAESFLAVGGFADHFEVGASFQGGKDASAHDGVVVR
jgi:hypothetical protein